MKYVHVFPTGGEEGKLMCVRVWIAFMAPHIVGEHVYWKIS